MKLPKHNKKKFDLKGFTKLAKQTDEYKNYCEACGREHAE